MCGHYSRGAGEAAEIFIFSRKERKDTKEPDRPLSISLSETQRSRVKRDRFDVWTLLSRSWGGGGDFSYSLAKSAKFAKEV
jgi:hypothetical protein